MRRFDVRLIPLKRMFFTGEEEVQFDEREIVLPSSPTGRFIFYGHILLIVMTFIETKPEYVPRDKPAVADDKMTCYILCVFFLFIKLAGYLKTRIYWCQFQKETPTTTLAGRTKKKFIFLSVALHKLCDGKIRILERERSFSTPRSTAKSSAFITRNTMRHHHHHAAIQVLSWRYPVWPPLALPSARLGFRFLLRDRAPSKWRSSAAGAWCGQRMEFKWKIHNRVFSSLSLQGLFCWEISKTDRSCYSFCFSLCFPILAQLVGNISINFVTSPSAPSFLVLFMLIVNKNRKGKKKHLLHLFYSFLAQV